MAAIFTHPAICILTRAFSQVKLRGQRLVIDTTAVDYCCILRMYTTAPNILRSINRSHPPSVLNMNINIPSCQMKHRLSMNVGRCIPVLVSSFSRKHKQMSANGRYILSPPFIPLSMTT